MNKQNVIQAVVAKLRSELEVYERAARAAHAEATHEQSKAENKYDTRGLEASYLARGQSRQAAEIVLAIQEFESLSASDWPAETPIDIGALVELEQRKQHAYYLIGPRAGGTEVECDGEEVLVITPQSPLGQQLVGRNAGEKVALAIAGARSEFKVTGVW